jgi:hypothetical protein
MRKTGVSMLRSTRVTPLSTSEVWKAELKRARVMPPSLLRLVSRWDHREEGSGFEREIESLIVFPSNPPWKSGMKVLIRYVFTAMTLKTCLQNGKSQMMEWSEKVELFRLG